MFLSQNRVTVSVKTFRKLSIFVLCFLCVMQSVCKGLKATQMCRPTRLFWTSRNHTNTAWTYVFICAMKGVRLIGGETVFEFPEQSWGFWFGLAEPWVVCGAAYGPFISQSFHHTTHRGLSSYLHLLPFSCFTKHRKRKFQVAISWLRLRHYRMSRCVHRCSL